MKAKFCVAALVMSFLIMITGCNIFDKNSKSVSDGGVVEEPSLVRGVAGSVSFKIKFPGSGEATASSNVLSSILAAEGVSPAVTFKLILINTGNSSSPTTTFVKKVAVMNGAAEVSFSGVPAATCIGDVLIEGGSLNSFREFHGMMDLVADAENTIIIVPKNTGLLEDVMVRIVEKGLLEAGTFSNAPAALTVWLQLMMTRFDLTSTTVVDDAFAELKTSFAAGAPLPMKNEPVSVSLPAGTSLATASMVVVSPYAEVAVNSDGNANVAQIQEFAANTASLLVCQNDSENSVLMRMSFDSTDQSATPLSVESTAEAFVMIDPLFVNLNTTQISQIRLALKQHANYSKLLDEIRQAILSNPSDPFDPEIQTTLYDLINQISRELYSSVLPSSSLRMATTYNCPVFSVSAEGQKIDNNSFCNYIAEVKKDNLLWKDIYLNRKTFLGGFWASPQVCFDNKVLDWLLTGSLLNPNSGDGLVEISFSKDSGLSLADGVISLLVSFAGVAKPSLNSDVRIFASVLNDTWKTVKSASTSNSTSELAGNLIKTVMASKEVMRRLTIIIFRSAGTSWVRTVLRVIMKKLIFILTVGEATYAGTEMILITNSVLHDPEGITEKAYQRDGVYPVGNISSIVLKNGPEGMQAGQTFDLNDIEIDINYDKVERTIISADGTASKETLAEAMIRTHTTTTPAFAKGISQVEWTGDNLRETVFTAPVDAGNYTLTCTYSEGVDNGKIQVSADLVINVVGITSLTFSTPKKLLTGEQLDLSEVTVTANYSDGTNKVVSGTWSGNYVSGGVFTAPSVGVYKVLCTYSESTDGLPVEKTAELSLTVIGLSGITLSPSNYSTYAGKTFDLTKVGVDAVYSDGSKEEITDQSQISWFFVSGSGSIAEKVYVAPESINVSSVKDVLKCSFSRSGATAEANLSISVAQGRFTRDKVYPDDPYSYSTVLTDHLTGLQWAGIPLPDGVTSADWYEYKNLAATSEYAGGGWRMPSLAEAQSVVPDAFNAGFFIAPGTYSSSAYIWTTEDRYSKEPPNSLYDPSLEPTHQTMYIMAAKTSEQWRYASTKVAYAYMIRSKK